jgi:hypothetical protein
MVAGRNNAVGAAIIADGEPMRRRRGYAARFAHDDR